MLTDDETRTAYMAAWDEWRQQVEHLHRVFFDDEPIRPDQLKGLLNREARKKEAYDAARLRLIGLAEALPANVAPGENPFKTG
jgi:hypothetical protein